MHVSSLVSPRKLLLGKKIFSTVLFLALLLQPITPSFLLGGFFIPVTSAQTEEVGKDAPSESEKESAPEEKQTSEETKEETSEEKLPEPEVSNMPTEVSEDTEKESPKDNSESSEETSFRVDEDGKATLEKVELNKTYIAPQNEDVTVTFTKLPEAPGSLTIEEMTLTEEQVAEIGALSDKAYDITSSMKNGSFEYELTLPVPEGQKEVAITYAEKIEELKKAVMVDEVKTDAKESRVTAKLNHFTIFVVTGVNDSGSCVGSGLPVQPDEKCYTTIQQAIDASAGGDIINVQPGIYREQLTFNDKTNVTLQRNGNAGTVVIESPDTTDLVQASSEDTPVVYVTDSTDITLKNITVDGRDQGTGTSYFAGIEYFNASGIIDDVIVKNTRWDASNGVQAGEGIILWATEGDRSVTVKNSRIETFQKTGILAYKNGSLTANIENNEIVCQGAVNFIAQNAIQMSYGAQGSIKGNTITGCSYINESSPDNRAASGIILYNSGTGVEVQDNTVAENDNGLYIFSTGANGSIVDNTFTNNFIALSIVDDVSTPLPDLDNAPTLEENAFTENETDIDLPNFKIFDARDTTTWSVDDQNSLDQIEAKINHNCAGSPFVRGTCNPADYASGGSVQYADEDTIAPGVPTASFKERVSGTAVESGGFTDEIQFTFSLSSDADTTRYQLKYWNDIPSSPFKEGSPWNPTDLNAYSPSLGMYQDQFTQGEGTHFFAFSACDNAGNCSTYGSPFTVTYDVTAPSTPIHEAPADNGFLTNNTFTFQWTDVPGAVEYEFQSATSPAVDGNGILTTGVWNNKINGGPDRNYLTESEILSYGANGAWYWQVRARDAAGNWSTWTTP